METNVGDMLIYILATIAGIVLLAAIIYRFATWLSEFQQELKYINNEIGRTRGDERHHWKKRKRRLLLSLLPFIRY